MLQTFLQNQPQGAGRREGPGRVHTAAETAGVEEALLVRGRWWPLRFLELSPSCPLSMCAQPLRVVLCCKQAASFSSLLTNHTLLCLHWMFAEHLVCTRYVRILFIPTLMTLIPLPLQSSHCQDSKSLCPSNPSSKESHTEQVHMMNILSGLGPEEAKGSALRGQAMTSQERDIEECGQILSLAPRVLSPGNQPSFPAPGLSPQLYVQLEASSPRRRTEAP